jgi:hypothetical protein
MEEVLNNVTTRPFWKISKLLQESLDNNVITPNQFERFDEELHLLLRGINQSSFSRPRVTSDINIKLEDQILLDWKDRGHNDSPFD